MNGALGDNAQKLVIKLKVSECVCRLQEFIRRIPARHSTEDQYIFLPMFNYQNQDVKSSEAFKL